MAAQTDAGTNKPEKPSAIADETKSPTPENQQAAETESLLQQLVGRLQRAVGYGNLVAAASYAREALRTIAALRLLRGDDPVMTLGEHAPLLHGLIDLRTLWSNKGSMLVTEYGILHGAYCMSASLRLDPPWHKVACCDPYHPQVLPGPRSIELTLKLMAASLDVNLPDSE